jgi:hypothetical protein
MCPLSATLAPLRLRSVSLCGLSLASCVCIGCFDGGGWLSHRGLQRRHQHQLQPREQRQQPPPPTDSLLCQASAQLPATTHSLSCSRPLRSAAQKSPIYSTWSRDGLFLLRRVTSSSSGPRDPRTLTLNHQEEDSSSGQVHSSHPHIHTQGTVPFYDTIKYQPSSPHTFTVTSVTVRVTSSVLDIRYS